MNTLAEPVTTTPEPVAVRTDDDALTVDLSDGRTIVAPLQWFPRLWHATPTERDNHELGRVGVHWPDVDEDVSVAALLRGERSGETPQSVQRWLNGREAATT